MAILRTPDVYLSKSGKLRWCEGNEEVPRYEGLVLVHLLGYVMVMYVFTDTDGEREWHTINNGGYIDQAALDKFMKTRQKELQNTRV